GAGSGRQVSGGEVDGNGATYLEQVFKVLDRERLEIRRNSEWFSKFSLEDVIRLAGKMTVARMLERQDFHRRYETGHEIGIHEFLYPLMQGWDSVMIKADVELGGTDQTFNLLV